MQPILARGYNGPPHVTSFPVKNYLFVTSRFAGCEVSVLLFHVLKIIFVLKIFM
jgi:hypothetical protein